MLQSSSAQEPRQKRWSSYPFFPAAPAGQYFSLNIFFLQPIVLKTYLNQLYIRNMPWWFSNHCHQHKRMSHLVLHIWGSVQNWGWCPSRLWPKCWCSVAPKDTSAEMKQSQWNVLCMLLKLLLWAPFMFQSKESAQKPSHCHFKQSTVRGGSPGPWGLWPRTIWLHSHCFYTVSFLYKNVNT